LKSADTLITGNGIIYQLWTAAICKYPAAGELDSIIKNKIVRYQGV